MVGVDYTLTQHKMYNKIKYLALFFGKIRHTIDIYDENLGQKCLVI